jgi:hypothetical protein
MCVILGTYHLGILIYFTQNKRESSLPCIFVTLQSLTEFLYLAKDKLCIWKLHSCSIYDFYFVRMFVYLILFVLTIRRHILYRIMWSCFVLFSVFCIHNHANETQNNL